MVSILFNPLEKSPVKSFALRIRSIMGRVSDHLHKGRVTVQDSFSYPITVSRLMEPGFIIPIAGNASTVKGRGVGACRIPPFMGT